MAPERTASMAKDNVKPAMRPTDVGGFRDKNKDVLKLINQAINFGARDDSDENSDSDDDDVSSASDWSD